MMRINPLIILAGLLGVAAMTYAKKTSAKGLDYIRRFEKFEPRPYQDVGGKWTVGYGHLIQPGEYFTEITRAQGEAIFAQDVAKAERAINELVTVPLNQNQFDALTSLVFNIGRQNFSTSTLLRVLNAGDYAAAANEFLRWKYAGGQQVAGLYNRRVAEKATWEA